MKSNNYTNKKDNKSFGYSNEYIDGLIFATTDYISINGFRLDKNRGLIPIFYNQFKSELKVIVIRKSFFKNHWSLLLELITEPFTCIKIFYFDYGI